MRLQLQITEWKSIALVALILVSCLTFVATEFYVCLLLPLLAFCIPSATALNLKGILFALFFCVPLSYEMYFSIGLGTDLPTEQLMWFLTAVCLWTFVVKWRRIPALYVVNPISLSILFVVAWVLLTVFTSQSLLHSIKYFLAKIWYIVALYCAPLFLLKSDHDVKKLFKYLNIGLFISILSVFARHIFEGLTYESINFVLWPFYRNHVNYASMMAVALPFVLWYTYQLKSKKWFRYCLATFIFYLVALYFTYTRAAILSVVLAVPFLLVVKWKLVRFAFAGAVVVVGLFFGSMIHKYNFLDYAPNYETTIQHLDFEDVLSATYRLEDLSTMERFYRWVAGYNMIKERPVFGFGPANFYSFYKAYTVKAFTTYVSDNEDQSGIHNYYLMLLVEQGIPGLLIFIALIFFTLQVGEQLYHSHLPESDRQLILAALCSIFIALTISFMNDMLETDKVGAVFFLSLALITRFYVKAKGGHATTENKL